MTDDRLDEIERYAAPVSRVVRELVDEVRRLQREIADVEYHARGERDDREASRVEYIAEIQRLNARVAELEALAEERS